MENRFNYFYGSENEQYLFLQMPWMLIKDDNFKGLSDSSKILYSLFLNRTSLSAKNGWTDDEGRVYIIYTLKEIEQDLNCAEQKALKSMKELKDIGLVNTIRRGLTQPNIIYVMNFATNLKYPVNEKKEPESRIKPLNRDFHGTETMIITEQKPLKSGAINTDTNKTDNIGISIYPAQAEPEAAHQESAGAETIDLIDTQQPEIPAITKETVADKIGLSELLSEFPDKEQKIYELYDTICDVLTTDNTEKIRVAKRQLPAAAVKQEFSELGKGHIIYVLDCLEKNGGNIKDNSKGYIITSLYNSNHSIGYYKPRNQSAFKDDGNSKPKAKSEYDISNFFERRFENPVAVQ